MRFDLLASSRLFLVDAYVTPTQVTAGYVYSDGSLDEVETLLSFDGQAFDVHIPKQTQQIKVPAEFYLDDDVVEFDRVWN